MNKTMELRKKKTVCIKPSTPFNFEGTFFKPSHFPSKLVVCDNRKLYQAVEVGNKVFGVVISEKSDSVHSAVKVEIFSKNNITEKDIKSVESEIRIRYNLDEDIKEFLKKFRSDKLLSGPVNRWGGMRPSIAYSLYGFLMVTTVLQNATVRRTVQMMDNLLNEFGIKLIFANKEVYAVWKPEDIEKVEEDKLRELRVGYRAKIIKKISHAFASGEISENELRVMKDKEEIKKRLLKLYGVGPQSVSYILFEAFHFYDTLDHLSPWEGKIVSMLLYNKKTVEPKRIMKRVEKRWGKWKMLALHYLFEDLFWRRKNEHIEWLEEEIRD